jgi:hypothetical protein
VAGASRPGAVRKLALAKGSAAGGLPGQIGPAPPQGQVAVMLSGGGPSRLLRFLRMRCMETGSSMGRELYAMLKESVDG